MDQKKEIPRKNFKSEINKNDNKTYQDLWGTIKAVLKGEFIAINVHREKRYLKLPNRSLMMLGKQEQNKPKASTRKEIMKNRINEIAK